MNPDVSGADYSGSKVLTRPINTSFTLYENGNILLELLKTYIDTYRCVYYIHYIYGVLGSDLTPINVKLILPLRLPWSSAASSSGPAGPSLQLF